MWKTGKNDAPDSRLHEDRERQRLNIRFAAPTKPWQGVASSLCSESLYCFHAAPFYNKSVSVMPRAIKGALIECDPPQMAMIRKIDKENNNAYIIEEIDDKHCLVKENKVAEIRYKVKALMDDAMKPTGAMEIDSEKDSDMD